MSMASRRPPSSSSSSRGDIDVEDELQQLLKEQEEFMRQRARPAAKITRVGGAPPPVEEQPAQSEEPAPDDGVQVVGAVKERDVVTLDGDTRMRVTSGGFPAVTRIRGESVFGRRQRQQRPPPSAGETMATLSGKGKIVERPPDVVSGQTKALASTATRADAVSERERQEIDAANAATLRNMSTADIRAAQQELASMLDPALLAKLKSRRPQPPTPATGKKREDVVAATRQLEAAGVDLSTIETEEQLFAAAAKLPIDERAKHAWMQPVPNTEKTDTKSKKTSRLPVRANQPKRADTKKQPSGERFDFDGHVVVGDHQPPSHSGLYHHGDDPDAAGYTMDELLHLARSTVASQRAVALLTISKILHQRPQTSAPNVLPAELPVALRMALDDQNYTALSAALAAMHAYLCPRREEHASRTFESARGTVVAMPAIHIHVDVGTTKDELLHEVIYLDTTESEEDGSKIGDQELASLDPVQGLLKMAIVSRLRFIVTAIQLPDDDAMDKLLEILLQIATHSPRAAQAIASDRNLLKALQTKYLENELVLTLQTEPAEAFTHAAARTLKVLRLVRVLCQGSRAVAKALVEGGVIQSTKGFLAIRSDGETGGTTIKDPLEKIHLETLRVWRVLLQYGLDFHCVAYLYPLLCGFDGVGLVRDKATDTAASAGGTRRWSDRCLAAIFAALEAFARLETIHEAQHYFHHLGFFTRLAQEEIGRRFKHLGEKIEDVVFVTVALRFLTACCGLVDKFHFDKTPFTETLKTLLQSAIPASTVIELDLLVAITTFGSHAIDADLVDDDQDEEDVRRRLFLQWKPFISKRIASSDSTEPLATCELLLLTTESCLRTNHHDNAFLCSLYSAALQLVQELQPGHQFWVHRLFTDVLFHPVVLQQTGFFPDLQDATAMSRVLIPMYQALVNSTRGQEAHSQLLFGMPTNPKQTQTLHLVDPQDEHDYVGSNLPLPFDWLFCPFSRVEYLSQSTADASKKQKHAATVLGPSHAEADEMKVIVSAACRYIDQLESLGVATSSGAARLGDEDKLFHLMHVFFAGTDVLFDDYVDLALSKLLAKYAVSVLHHPSPTALYDGLLRNLRQIESLEAGDNRNETPTSFTTETQTVLTFVEKLVNEFTSSSFGNTHFAKLVTLFLLHDFPLEIRKWVWKELAASRLVHRLEPFNAGGAGGVDVRSAMGLRATRDAKHSDVTLVRAVTDAIATRHQGGGVVSHERGPFAYWLAIHHTAAYLFGDDANRAELSSARQQLLQDLVVDASPVVWRHLLSHETSRFSPTANADIKQVRVDRVLQHAAFTDAQVQAFRAVLDLAKKSLL